MRRDPLNKQAIELASRADRAYTRAAGTRARSSRLLLVNPSNDARFPSRSIVQRANEKKMIPGTRERVTSSPIGLMNPIHERSAGNEHTAALMS